MRQRQPFDLLRDEISGLCVRVRMLSQQVPLDLAVCRFDLLTIVVQRSQFRGWCVGRVEQDLQRSARSRQIPNAPLFRQD